MSNRKWQIENEKPAIEWSGAARAVLFEILNLPFPV
jgi:hypothetical protein